MTHVPSSVLPHLVGSGGRNLKALMTRTLTKIVIPRKDSEKSEEEQVEEEVVITGDFTGVEAARKEIEEIVAQRVRYPSIDSFIDIEKNSSSSSRKNLSLSDCWFGQLLLERIATGN